MQNALTFLLFFFALCFGQCNMKSKALIMLSRRIEPVQLSMYCGVIENLLDLLHCMINE